jgi:hypothetical protein
MSAPALPVVACAVWSRGSAAHVLDSLSAEPNDLPALAVPEVLFTDEAFVTEVYVRAPHVLREDIEETVRAVYAELRARAGGE